MFEMLVLVRLSNESLTFQVLHSIGHHGGICTANLHSRLLVERKLGSFVVFHRDIPILRHVALYMACKQCGSPVRKSTVRQVSQIFKSLIVIRKWALCCGMQILTI